MKIIVGSKNPSKVEAVKEILNDYNDFSKAEVIGLEVSSGVDNQPKSLDETIKGAMNRAKACFIDCDYSIGLESGLMKIPHTKTGYMDFTCCAIFDGKNVCLGLSSCFEYPKEITRLVLEEGIDINQAFIKKGLTKNPKLGSAEGAIGFLTKGRVIRREYTKQAIQMALIHLENPDLY
jgi:inosine/xanthosine triphosphatase